MKISSNVGQGAYSQKPADVTLVQVALGAIRDKRYKPYFQGKADGRCGNDLIDAICRFQLDNRLQVSGRLEPIGPAWNQLVFKTPFDVRQRLDASAGGSTGAGGTIDKAKVMAANRKLAADIRTLWPLPAPERESLARIVEKVAEKGLVPLAFTGGGKHAVSIGGDGSLQVRFDIAPWAFSGLSDDRIAREAMIKAVGDLMAFSTEWRRGDPANLVYQTSRTLKELRPHSGFSAAFMRAIGIAIPPTDPVICACIASAETLFAGDVA